MEKIISNEYVETICLWVIFVPSLRGHNNFHTCTWKGTWPPKVKCDGGKFSNCFKALGLRYVHTEQHIGNFIIMVLSNHPRNTCSHYRNAEAITQLLMALRTEELARNPPEGNSQPWKAVGGKAYLPRLTASHISLLPSAAWSHLVPSAIMRKGVCRKGKTALAALKESWMRNKLCIPPWPEPSQYSFPCCPGSIFLPTARPDLVKNIIQALTRLSYESPWAYFATCFIFKQLCHIAESSESIDFMNIHPTIYFIIIQIICTKPNSHQLIRTNPTKMYRNRQTEKFRNIITSKQKYKKITGQLTYIWVHQPNLLKRPTEDLQKWLYERNLITLIATKYARPRETVVSQHVTLPSTATNGVSPIPTTLHELMMLPLLLTVFCVLKFCLFVCFLKIIFNWLIWLLAQSNTSWAVIFEVCSLCFMHKECMCLRVYLLFPIIPVGSRKDV